jgi:RND family efflux transporter MFP subunit
MKKQWWILGAATLAIAGGAWLANNQSESIPAIQLKREDVTATLTVTGEVRADTTVNFTPVVTAEIASVNVDEGDWIRSGQTLVTLNSAQQQAQLQQARDQAQQAQEAYANVQQGTRPEQILYQEQRYAESSHRVKQSEAALKAAMAQQENAVANARRFQQLYSQELVSAQEYDNAQLQATVAQRTVDQQKSDLAAARKQRTQIAAQLSEARNGPTRPELAEASAAAKSARDNIQATAAQLNNYRIVSNFQGIVVERLKDPGDLGRPGDVILKAVNPETLQIVCDVEENDLGKVKAGNAAYIVLDALPDTLLQGRILRVGSQVNPDNGTVETRVVLLPSEWKKVSTTGLLPGMTADVNVITGQLKNALVLPASAVKNKNGQWLVYVFNGKRIQQKAVRGERISMESFRVTGGLQAGDWVANVANEKLLEKKNVKPTPAQSTPKADKPPASMGMR